ncbi:MAG: hypothetical protein WBQ73_01880 [Candidatus Babeliales bacterium]
MVVIKNKLKTNVLLAMMTALVCIQNVSMLASEQINTNKKSEYVIRPITPKLVKRYYKALRGKRNRLFLLKSLGACGILFMVWKVYFDDKRVTFTQGDQSNLKLYAKTWFLNQSINGDATKNGDVKNVVVEGEKSLLRLMWDYSYNFTYDVFSATLHPKQLMKFALQSLVMGRVQKLIHAMTQSETVSSYVRQNINYGSEIDLFDENIKGLKIKFVGKDYIHVERMLLANTLSRVVEYSAHLVAYIRFMIEAKLCYLPLQEQEAARILQESVYESTKELVEQSTTLLESDSCDDIDTLQKIFHEYVINIKRMVNNFEALEKMVNNLESGGSGVFIKRFLGII